MDIDVWRSLCPAFAPARSAQSLSGFFSVHEYVAPTALRCVPPRGVHPYMRVNNMDFCHSRWRWDHVRSVQIQVTRGTELSVGVRRAKGFWPGFLAWCRCQSRRPRTGAYGLCSGNALPYRVACDPSERRTTALERCLCIFLSRSGLLENGLRVRRQWLIPALPRVCPSSVASSCGPPATWRCM